MLVLDQISAIIQQNYGNVMAVLVLILFYGVYLYYFKYHEVIVKGNYNARLKNIGKTIPPYPNGWFIVCKSQDIAPGQSKAIDQSGHNITVFRNKESKLFALHSYCAHLGANLGIGGKVVGQNCIQCPFHGWLYDGDTGVCVDYDNKPMKVLNVEYNDDMGSQTCKNVQWKHGKQQHAKLRKYHVKQMHGFIYLWLHVDQNQQPQFDVINIQNFKSKLSSRGYTKHTIRCHAQDIPENGADSYHFKYVHKLPLAGINQIYFTWSPNWKPGNDPNLADMFEHKQKNIRQFKQSIYHNLIKDHKNKECLSISNIDNYITIPLLGKLFVFNLTVIQMGPGLVYVFLKSHYFSVIFIQYLQTKGEYQQQLYHEAFTSNWLPYWVSSIILRGEGMQVTNDMYIWDSKKFGHKINYKSNFDADQFIIKWRTWFSKYYKGCKKQKQKAQNIDW